MSNTVDVFCVYKTGGDFTLSDVARLRDGITDNTTVKHNFYCLTDDPMVKELKCYKPLIMNYKGWWSKIELFRKGLSNADRILYFDLDTSIVRNIDDLFKVDFDFVGLRPFNDFNYKRPNYIASGIMSWKNGMFNFLFDEFEEKHIHKFRGDQDYINSKLKQYKVKTERWQNHLKGIYSYKRHILTGKYSGIPKVVCFHGKPRLNNELDNKLQLLWTKLNW